MANTTPVKLEIALRSHLIAQVAAAGGRVYPDILPEKPTYPAITYAQVYSNTHHDIDIDFPRYQITAWHPRRVDAINLADEINNALNRFKGYLNNEAVKQIAREPSPGVLFDRDAGIDGVYYVPQDFKIIFYRKKGV